MNWFVLTLLSVFAASLANILFRVLMKDTKSDPILYAVVFCFVLGILNLPVALLHGFSLPPFNTNLVFFFLAAALWGLGTIFAFKAFQLLESSEVIILTSVRALITIVVSFLVLHEVINGQKIIGTILILSSVLLVSQLKKRFTFNKGVLFALGSALANGVAVVFDVVNLKQYDAISYLVIINFLIGFVIVGFYPKTVWQWKIRSKPVFLTKMAPVILFSFLQAILYYSALAQGPTSQIAPINQAQVILTVLLAAVLLREKDKLGYKIIASILVMVGVLLLR